MRFATRLVPVLLLAVGTTAFGQIVNSKHDLRTGAGDGQKIGAAEICQPCHVPHNAVHAADQLLWNHEYTTQTGWVFYKSGSDMSGESKICLGCHDGVTGMDNYGGTTDGTDVMTNATTIIAQDMSQDHPVGFDFPGGTTGFWADATAESNGVKLPGGRVECTSCHEPHDTLTGSGKFLRLTTANSTLCVACHDK